MIKTLSHIWINITRPYRRKLHRIIDDIDRLHRHVNLLKKIYRLPIIKHHTRLFNTLLEGRAQHAHEYGYWQYSLQYWQYAEQLRALLRNKNDNDNTQIFLYNSWVNSIGHIALIHHFIRFYHSTDNNKKILIYNDGTSRANQYLYDKLSPFCTFLSIDDYKKSKHQLLLHNQRIAIHHADGKNYRLLDFLALCYHHSHKAQLPPLLNISNDEKQLFYNDLQKIGVDKNKWFVTLHLRGNAYPAYHQNYPKHQQESLRNSDIEPYLLASQTIIDAGGQVVLLGDDDKIIPDNMRDNIIDYAHSDIRCAQYDIMLCAENLFLIGNNSGIIFIPSLFGKSVLISDQIPYAHQTTRHGDLWLPKKLYCQMSQSVLTIQQAFNEPLGYIEIYQAFAENNIKAIDNNKEEINDAVKDMLMSLHILEQNNDFDDAPYQAFVRACDKAITQPIYSKIAPSFIRHNLDLFIGYNDG